MSEETKADLVVHKGGYTPPALVQGGTVTAIVPQDIDQAWRLADIIARADMAPRSYDRSQEKIMVGIMHGLEVGLTPMAALQSIAVINGTPSIWGDGAMGLVESSGLMENIEERIDGEDENRVAVCIIRRKDRETPIEQHFSIEDAGLAGLLTKDPWQKYPQRMLQMRARSWALRDGFADVLKGLNIREEVEDYVGATPAPPRPERSDFKETETDEAETVEHEIADDGAVFTFTDQYGATDEQPLNEGQFTDRLAAAMDECNVGAALNSLLEHNADALAALFEPAKKTVEKKLKAANKRLRAAAVDNEHKGKPKAKAKPKTKAKTKAKAGPKTSKAKAKPKTTETSKATEPTDSEAAEPSTEDDSSEKPPPPVEFLLPMKDSKGRVKEREYQTAILNAVHKAGDVETVDAILKANADSIKALSALYSKNIEKGADARKAKLA